MDVSLHWNSASELIVNLFFVVELYFMSYAKEFEQLILSLKNDVFFPRG